MDPVACFNELVSSFVAQDWQEARERALDLADWLNRGGFVPSPFRKADLVGFCVVVDRVCRTHTERHFGDD